MKRRPSTRAAGAVLRGASAMLVLAGSGCSGHGLTGHTADAGDAGNDSGIAVTITSATPEGTNLRIGWQSSAPIQNIWYPACGTAPRLLDWDGSAWSPLPDDRPREGTMQPYYLDGIYYENGSLGCDGGNSCNEANEVTVTTLAYVQVDTRPPPAPYYPNSGTGLTDAPVPDIVSRATAGPYRLELKYMIGGCPSAEIGTAILAVPPG